MKSECAETDGVRLEHVRFAVSCLLCFTAFLTSEHVYRFWLMNQVHPTCPRLSQIQIIHTHTKSGDPEVSNLLMIILGQYNLRLW